MLGFQRLGQAVLLLGTLAALWMVPGPAWAHASPETGALYGYLLTCALLIAFRTHPRFVRAEHSLLVLFLGAMPLVYLEAAWFASAPLGLQLLGLALYVALAVAGLWYPWVLVGGIALHGLGWDLWHLHRGVVADWYALACAIIDVSLASYAAGRVSAWQAGHTRSQ